MSELSAQAGSYHEMRILGVDPGTATTGYGVIDVCGGNTYRCLAAGVIRTSKEACHSQRLRTIREDLLLLLDEFSPHVLAIESLFFFKNAKTVISVAQARGVILEACASAGLKVVEYTPMQVKMTIAGYGKADKKQIQSTVARLVSTGVINPDDASDAVAIAICHARSHKVVSAVRQNTA